MEEEDDVGFVFLVDDDDVRAVGEYGSLSSLSLLLLLLLLMS